VVGVECVSQPERVGGKAEPDRESSGSAEVIVVRSDEREQDKEADGVQPDHDTDHPGDDAPLVGGQGAAQTLRA
jgi:hypothetical protein